MDIYYKSIDDITEADIGKLVTDKIPESLIIDYKLMLPGNSDADKKEFLADITSLANSSGGILLYGIQEEKDAAGQNTGLPEKIVPINLNNPDSEISRISSIIQDSIEPKLFNVLYRALKVGDDKYIVLVKIPNSISSPHIVWFKKSGKFFKRINSNKIQLDVYDIKNAFLESDDILKQKRTMLVDRINEIRTLSFIPNLDIDGSTLIHIIPINNKQIDLKIIKDSLGTTLIPIGYSGWGTNFNYEGVLIADLYTSPIQSYVQVMRNGGVEIYSSLFHYKNKEICTYSAIKLEHYFFEYIKKYFEACKKIDLTPPFIVYISIFDLERYNIIESNGNHSIQRKQIILPPVVIEDFNINIGKTFQPTFNILWQSFGYSESPDYLKRNSDFL